MIDGIIYKLFCKDFDEFYIGSTTKFHHRKKSHKSCCNNEKNKDYNIKVYKYIRDNGGYDNWNYEIVELGEYQDKNCMKNRERYFIETLKPSLNSNIPNRSIKEWRIDEYEKVQAVQKKYRETHKEEKKEYYEKNKEIISKKKKEYRANNREIISKQRKEYRETHKEEIKKQKEEWGRKKIECEICNCKITRAGLSKHKKSEKHIRNLNNTKLTDFLN
tara:strand:- start:1700 stop:2353 length:654 start_codon:yes stop_codon:yes gene_type:complete